MRFIIVTTYFLLIAFAHAGGGPQNILVVVNQNSSNSVALGKYYAQQRGIPERNIFRIDTPSASNDIALVAFSNQIRGPIFAYLEDSGLDDQIDYILFSRDIPYRVYLPPYLDYRHASLTSTMYYDFFSSPNAFTIGCDLAAGSSNHYFAREMAFRRPDAPVNSRYRISAMITSSNHQDAFDLIDRSVAADYGQPQATVFFEHGEQLARNGRWVQYEDAGFNMSFLSNAPVVAFPEAVGDTSPRTNAMGLMTGVANYPRFSITDLIPGSIAEHLTSYGGHLFDNRPHMKIINWLENGASGSYGTVVEPCAFPQKFPRANLHYWYGRGFSLGESFYMAVENPYQGVLLGDPMTQPYAVRPLITLDGVSENEEVSGTVSLIVTGSTTVAGVGVDRIDLYINDIFHGHVVSQPLVPSNVVTVTIGGIERSYTNKPGDNLTNLTAGLANAINAHGAIPAQALAAGDRIVLRQKNLGEAGTGITYDVNISMGTATQVGALARAAGSQFTESIYYALTTAQLTGTVQNGDSIQSVVTRLDGVAVTNTITAGSGASAQSLLLALRDAINQTPDLQGPEGCRTAKFSDNGSIAAEMCFIARTPGWQGYAPSVTISSSSPALVFMGGGLFNANTNTLTARGAIFFSAGAATVSTTHVLSTTNLPDGPHALRLVAHRGDGPGTQGQIIRTIRVKNHDLEVVVTNLAAAVTLSIYEPAVVQGVFADPAGTVTQVVLWIEGKPVAVTNQGPFEFIFDPAWYGVGDVTLQVQVFNDLGQSTLSDPVIVSIRADVTTANGVPHAWLVSYGITNNFEAASVDDPDLDGVPTWQEYVMNTDPTDGTSFLRVDLSAEAPPDYEVRWFAATGRVYSLSATESLLDTWLAVVGATNMAGQGAWLVLTNPVSVFETNQFFRVRVAWPEAP